MIIFRLNQLKWYRRLQRAVWSPRHRRCQPQRYRNRSLSPRWVSQRPPWQLPSRYQAPPPSVNIVHLLCLISEEKCRCREYYFRNWDVKLIRKGCRIRCRLLRTIIRKIRYLCQIWTRTCSSRHKIGCVGIFAIIMIFLLLAWEYSQNTQNHFPVYMWC